MAKYMYYPGCSMDGTGKAYHDSIEAVLPTLDIGHAELDDWNCCGATEYMGISPLRSQALVGSNLALAEKQKNGTDTLVAPCSACYVNLARTALLADQSRHEAAEAVYQGLKIDPGHPELRELQRELGIRRPPVLGFLSRRNMLNQILGWLRHQVTSAGRRKKPAD
mgnify:CR=1 FL=1